MSATPTTTNFTPPTRKDTNLPNTIFTKAKRHADRAIARGDVETATRWTIIMREQVWIARSIIDLAARKPRPKAKLTGMTSEQRARFAAESKTALPSAMPVMLDPDGFSPGGSPNWYLNQVRLERAGLPRDLAPLTKAELRRQQQPTST